MGSSGRLQLHVAKSDLEKNHYLKVFDLYRMTEVKHSLLLLGSNLLPQLLILLLSTGKSRSKTFRLIFGYEIPM